MCAILGYVGRNNRSQWPTIYRLLTELFIASSARGVDASGFASLTSKGDLVVDKHPMPSGRFVLSRAWVSLRPTEAIICHCRMATHGDPAAPNGVNNHPFLSRDGKLALAHNGVIANYQDIAERNGLVLDGRCDSEVLIRLMEASNQPVSGFYGVLKAVHGSAAVAVLDVSRREVLLARNEGRPAWLCRMFGIGGTFFASTPELMMTAVKRTFGEAGKRAVQMLVPVAANSVTQLGVGGEIIAAADMKPPTVCFRPG